jgi:hypothetical protein
LGSRSKTDGPKVGLLDEDRVILTNEFFFEPEPYPPDGRVLFCDHDLPLEATYSPIQIEVESG